jgi:peptide subunit release factor RF-3
MFILYLAVTPLENRGIQRIDTSVFNGDKFGYEMVNFVKSFPKAKVQNVSNMWDKNFVRGLECLIEECAVIKDDIERECFVSHVYVWFADKLVERRDLPQQTDMGN